MPHWQIVTVSNTELDAAKQCPHKHHLAYRERWASPGFSPALSLGILWHLVMQTHYWAIKTGSSDRERRAAIAAILLDQPRPEEAELCAWMFDGYEERYGIDPQWEILEVEGQRLIRLPTSTGRPSRFFVRMRFDLLVRETLVLLGKKRKQRIKLVDHKSGRNLPTQKELDLDDQFGLYTWGLRSLGEDVWGSVYSAARSQRNKVVAQPLEERFARVPLWRGDYELETIAREAYAIASRAYAVPPGGGPRHPDSERCRWRCPYTEACLIGRKSGPGAEEEFLRSAGYVRQTEAEQLEQRGYGPEPMVPGGIR